MRLLAVLSSLVLLLASCSPALGSGPAFGVLCRHELILVLPPAPAAWAILPDLRMSVAWKAPGGSLRSASAAPGSSLRVEVDRGMPQAILALPSTRGSALMPAGALYPDGLEAPRVTGEGADELVLDWTGGYAASVAAALEGAGLDPWSFDLSRLAREASARCADPWRVPPLEVARRLSALEFRISAYEDPTRSAVSLPGPGPWAPESPFEAAPEGAVAMLSEGLWRFLSPCGEMLAALDAEGRSSFVRR